MSEYGPKNPVAEEIHRTKYRVDGESFYEAMTRIAQTLKSGDEHFRAFRDILLNQRFLPAGRIQLAIGSVRNVTPYNCFVSGPIPDSMDGIMTRAHEAAKTMRMGGGIGYDFSTLRPRGAMIKTLHSQSSGPISFMDIFDAVCRSISSAGHRRGAQMGVLRVDHPDIEEFIKAKQNSTRLTGFNVSIGITDEFMHAVKANAPFDLRFEGRALKTINAANLWEEIMRSTWDWAEPGVLFIDHINNNNNLYYCEKIAATNPCAEQPLPPYGACLLGSFNLTKYVMDAPGQPMRRFNWSQFVNDIYEVVPAMDRVVDVATYPLEAQAVEAASKRRMGLGITGLANAAEALGLPYGSAQMLAFTNEVLSELRNHSYWASANLAKERGAFSRFELGPYMAGKFIQTLPSYVQKAIIKHGIRNSHLTSIAPTGTISLSADNVSSGIEPPFSLVTQRTIIEFSGPRVVEVKDYAYERWGVKGKTAMDCTVDDHLGVLLTSSKLVDSAVSKTCNVNPDIHWDDFKAIYMRAWEGGAKGCTTFNPGGKRFGILNAAPVSEENEGGACYIDEKTGKKTCE